MKDAAAAFARHGVDHLSPSSLNRWIEEPAYWLLRQLGCPDYSGPRAWRGTALEAGFVALMSGRRDPCYALKVTFEEFDRLRAESAAKATCDPQLARRERDALDAFFCSGKEHFLALAPALATQQPCEITLPELPIPLIGHCDVTCENAAREIKTSTRLRLRSSHVRQAALYSRALGLPAWIDIVSPRGMRAVALDERQVRGGMQHLTRAALEIGACLAHSEDLRACASAVEPNPKRNPHLWNEPVRAFARANGLWVEHLA